jgi:Domain of unknown function (DUF4912)
MTKRKTKRNAAGWQARGGFKISRNPTVHIANDAVFLNADDRTARARVHRQPVLFAMPRDPRTIFASWNVDWQTVFEKALPADRQVHLRVIDGSGAIETAVTVEPMSEMHYLTMSGLHQSYRLELGYFQPLSTWHSVVTSAQIEMSPQESVALSNLDLVTIPFHLTFQQLTNLLGTANDASTAKVISEYQKRLLTSDQPNETTASDTQILSALNLSAREIAAAERSYKNIDNQKLMRHARSGFRFAGTSQVRGFGAKDAEVKSP